MSLYSEVGVKALKDPIPTTEASVSGEEEVLEEAIVKTSVKETEILQSSFVKDVRSSAEECVQEMLSVTYAACGFDTSATEAITGKHEDECKAEVTEATTTEDVPVPTTQSVTTGPACEKQETNICSEAAAIAVAAAEAAPAHDDHVSESAPSPVEAEELISLEIAATSMSDVHVPVQTRTHVAFDLMLDPLEYTTPGRTNAKVHRSPRRARGHAGGCPGDRGDTPSSSPHGEQQNRGSKT